MAACPEPYAHEGAAGGRFPCRPSRRYLVTGGLGYAGAWVTSRLAASGHEVFVLSRGSDTPELKPNPEPDQPADGQSVGRPCTPGGHNDPFSRAPEERQADFSSASGEQRPALPYTLVQADLAGQSPTELAGLLPERLDAVAHAASFNESFVPDYGQKALAVNALGTRNLLEALVLQGRRLERPLPLLVYFSTFHVYGASLGHIMESSPVSPRNDYALTHLFGEEYCRMFARTHGLAHIVARLSNGYGAPKTAASTKWYLLLNDLCKSAFEQGEIILRSDPSIARDFVWLGDVAAVVEALLGRPDLAGRVFNVSSGAALSLGEVAKKVTAGATRFLGKPIPLHQERPGTPDTKGAPFLHVDNTAVRAALNVAFHDRMDEEISHLLGLLVG